MEYANGMCERQIFSGLPGLGRRFGRVHPVGDQAIAGFCIGDPVQGVFDDAHPDTIASLLPVLATGIEVLRQDPSASPPLGAASGRYRGGTTLA